MPQKKNVITHKGRIIDWNKRDEEILIKLRKTYSNMINGYKLVRVSISSIGKVSGTLSTLEKNIDKLPKCKAYLDEITETVEQCQIRRCKKIIDDKKTNEQLLRLWEIQRVAGIRTKDFEINQISWLITNDEILSMFSQVGWRLLKEGKIKFDFLFNYLDLRVKVRKCKNHIKVIEILGVNKKRINIGKVNIYYPSLEESISSDQVKKIKYIGK